MVLADKLFKSIPSQSGVYLFCQKGKFIYVGKSQNLKARLLSHLQNAKYDLKEKLLIASSDKVKTFITNSDFKATVLEAELIKKYQPKYNVRWKDDKNFLYIKISVKDAYPKISTTRKENDSNSLYFGPFSSSNIVNKLLREIRKIIPFCSQTKLSKKTCFYSKIGLCNPCPNYILSVEMQHAASLQKLYCSNIKKIIDLLRGKSNIVLNSLHKKLIMKIKQQKYEECLELRNKIYLLKSLISERSFDASNFLNSFNVNNNVFFKRIECFDVSNLFGSEAAGSMIVFINGLPQKNQYRRFKIKTVKQISDIEMIKEILKRRFSRKDWSFPDLLVIDGGKPQVRLATKILKEFNLKIPVIGIAKNPDRIILTKRFKTLSLKENSPLFNLLKYMRDESHRFARKYHLLLRKKKMML